MLDDGLLLSDIAILVVTLLGNCFAVATLGLLILHRYRQMPRWTTALGYCRLGLVLLGLTCIGAVVAVYGASRADSAYAYFVYPTLLASSFVIASSLLALFLRP
jgi:hypothetical protein